MKTKHEEADVIVVAQAIYAAEVKSKKMVIVTDDVDIGLHVLLSHHDMEINLDASMIMQDTRKTRASVDIKVTVSHLQDIIPNLSALHCLTACNNQLHSYQYVMAYIILTL